MFRGGNPPPEDVHFNGPELLDRFRMEWSEWLTIKSYETRWAKSGTAIICTHFEDEEGAEIIRYLPYTGKNHNNHHNSGYLLDVLLAADVPPALVGILLQEGGSPLDALFEAVVGQKILCEMRWAEYQGKWYPTISRFVERPGRRPPAPTIKVPEPEELLQRRRKRGKK